MLDSLIPENEFFHHISDYSIRLAAKNKNVYGMYSIEHNKHELLRIEISPLAPN